MYEAIKLCDLLTLPFLMYVLMTFHHFYLHQVSDQVKNTLGSGHGDLRGS